MSKQPSQSRLELRDLGRRLIASLALIGLFAGGLPHVHEDGFPTDGSSLAVGASLIDGVLVTDGVGASDEQARRIPSGLTVSADDAHDTHSSGLGLEDLPCTLCRNAEERDDLIAETNTRSAAIFAATPCIRLTAPARKPAPQAHHHFGRAPPFALAS